MTKMNAIEFDAKYPTLVKYSEDKGIAQAKVMKLCGKKNPYNPKPYHDHRVVVNSAGEMSLQTEKAIRAII